MAQEEMTLGAWVRSLGKNTVIRDKDGQLYSRTQLLKDAPEWDEQPTGPILKSIYKVQDGTRAVYIRGWGSMNSFSSFPWRQLTALNPYEKIDEAIEFEKKKIRMLSEDLQRAEDNTPHQAELERSLGKSERKLARLKAERAKMS